MMVTPVPTFGFCSGDRAAVGAHELGARVSALLPGPARGATPLGRREGARAPPPRGELPREFWGSGSAIKVSLRGPGWVLGPGPG